MIDLKNSYIENDKGELLELFVAECEKQGIGDGYAGDGYEICYVSRGIIHGAKNYSAASFKSEKSQLTLADLKPKPRTKTEYVKCTISEAANYHVNELVFKWGEDLTTPISDVDASVFIINQHKLYRKVETEITWQDELDLFVDGSDLADCSEMATGHPGFFIKMCHLVASMTDKPE